MENLNGLRMRQIFSQDRKERRKSERVEARIPIACSLSKNNIVLNATTKDISSGGVKLELSQPLEKGDRLKILFRLPKTAKSISSMGKVVWYKRDPHQENVYEAGLKYARLKAKVKEILEKEVACWILAKQT